MCADDVVAAHNGSDIAAIIAMGEAVGGVGDLKLVGVHEIGVIAGL